MNQNQLSPREIRRYKRHIMLPEIGLEGQQKLKNTSVAVVGAGGLGTALLMYLASAGIGKLLIIDNEVINEPDLQRQVLYGYSDIGKHKSIVAHQKLQNINPDLQIDVRNTRLTAENAIKLTEGYEIIADCTDNFSTRYLINDLCILTNKPMVSGAIYKTQGTVGVFNFNNGPSFRCIHSEFIEDNKINDASSVGILSIIPGTIGTLQAIEIIKMATGFGEVISGKLLIIDVKTNLNYLINVVKNPDNFTITNLQSNY